MKFNDVYVVDDDKIFHFIIKKLLANNNIAVSPEFFENGLLALNGIKSKLDKGETPPDLILLDINMPVLDGWQFLEAYDLLDENVKNSIEIYMLSSSIDQRDIEYAAANKYALSFFGKPLTDEVVTRLASR
jgi:CheY-like chemotaxis protein